MSDLILHHRLGPIPETRHAMIQRPNFVAWITPNEHGERYDALVFTGRGQHWTVLDRSRRQAENFVRFRYDCYINSDDPIIMEFRAFREMQRIIRVKWGFTLDEAQLVLMWLLRHGLEAKPEGDVFRGHTCRALLIGAGLLNRTTEAVK